MDHHCYLTGNSLPALSLAQRELESLTKKAVESHFQRSFSEYQPWMSFDPDVADLSDLSQLSKTEARPQIRTDPRDLDLLDHTFSLGENRMGRVFDEVPYWRVMTPDSPERARFQQLATNAIQFLCTSAPTQSQRLKLICAEIIPVESSSPSNFPLRPFGSGLSTHFYRNGVFLSTPKEHPWALGEFILNLVHELGHQIVMLYQCGDAILSGDLKEPMYSVIRRTNRPAIKSFHALVATAVMWELMTDARSAFDDLWGIDRTNERAQYLKSDLDLALIGFHPSQFTNLGQRLYQEIVRISDRSLR